MAPAETEDADEADLVARIAITTGAQIRALLDGLDVTDRARARAVRRELFNMLMLDAAFREVSYA